jgi:hypothetical protein
MEHMSAPAQGPCMGLCLLQAQQLAIRMAEIPNPKSALIGQLDDLLPRASLVQKAHIGIALDKVDDDTCRGYLLLQKDTREVLLMMLGKQHAGGATRTCISQAPETVVLAQFITKMQPCAATCSSRYGLCCFLSGCFLTQCLTSYTVPHCYGQPKLQCAQPLQHQHALFALDVNEHAPCSAPSRHGMSCLNFACCRLPWFMHAPPLPGRFALAWTQQLQVSIGVAGVGGVPACGGQPRPYAVFACAFAGACAGFMERGCCSLRCQQQHGECMKPMSMQAGSPYAAVPVVAICVLSSVVRRASMVGGPAGTHCMLLSAAFACDTMLH